MAPFGSLEYNSQAIIERRSRDGNVTDGIVILRSFAPQDDRSLAAQLVVTR